MTDKDPRLEKIQRIVTELRDEYSNDPNVIGVGWGLATRGGKLKDGVSIIFHVRQKLPSDRVIETAGSKVIPDEIEGYPTDVQQHDFRPVQAGQRDETKYDPLRGGVASSNAEKHIAWFNGYGTLGILARDNATGDPVALSNWHVWGDGGEDGDQIIQPGHPTAGDHVEAIGKVAACGPLISSLIEWEAPSPLTWGLYGGAAAAAVAAALSDFRDPTRRGQDNTIPDPGEVTRQEWVDVEIEYPDLPLPGVAFGTKVDWKYHRETDTRVLSHDVQEDNTNTQFLLGKLVVTDRSKYDPGDRVYLTAAIWDYQPRPCDAYHVVAHLIPHNAPDTSLRVVLQPTPCPRTIPYDPPTSGNPGQRLCVYFKNYKVAEYPYKEAFAWLKYLDGGQQPVQIVDWFPGENALRISHKSLLLWHAPATEVVARVAQYANPPITLVAYNANGQILDQQTAPQQQGVAHELSLRGDGIVRVVLRGGDGEGLLLSYCAVTTGEEPITTLVSASTAATIRRELPTLSISGRGVKASRCCFGGSIALPPEELPGKWDVHMTVQNINNVPDGTPPDVAATVIGGHLLSSHTSAEFFGCTAIMFMDHVFDVI